VVKSDKVVMLRPVWVPGGRGRLSDEQRRALGMLALAPQGYTEATLLEEHGFSVGDIATLIMFGFAKWRPTGGRQKLFVVKITAAGRKIIGG
jgi:hypothetical protein